MADEPDLTQPAGGATALQTEVASVARNPYLFPFLGILYSHDPTLRTRGGGWNWLIYEEAELDPRIKTALNKRKGVLGAYPWQVDPASEAPIDVAAAELATRALKSVNLGKLTKDLQDAVLKGFAVDEIMWSVVDGEILPVEGRSRDQRRFKFRTDYGLNLIDWGNLLVGTPVPDKKFVVYSYDVKDGDPYGRGLGRILWWSAFFKRQNQTAWLIHNERFGSPTPWGKHQPTASEQEKDALFAALQGFQTEGAIMSSTDTEIELLAANSGAGADTFKLFKDAQNDDITEVILGQIFASDAGPLNGGANADADTDDRLEQARDDADAIATVINKSLIAWVVEINLPGARPPTLKWLIDAEEDLGNRADRDTKISEMGFEPTEKYIVDTYGGDWKKKAPVVPPAPIGGISADPDPAAPSFAEGAGRPAPGQVAVAAIADRAGDQVDQVMGSWVDQVRRVVQSASSLEEARDQLIGLYPGMSGAMFAEVMGQALTVANLAGRDGVKRGD